MGADRPIGKQIFSGLLVAAAAVAALAVFADNDRANVRAIPRDALRVDVAGTSTSRPIPAGYVGFSIEYWSSLAYSGTDPSAPNPAFVRLVATLSPGVSPIIRFGGDTTDWTWWPTPGVAKPAGVRYTLTPRWMSVTRASALAMGARLILGINFEADSRAIASAEAHAFLNGIRRQLIAGFELGNEPEVYGTIGWYTNSAHAVVYGRPAGYGFRGYLRDYSSIAAALPRGVPLVGPASGAPQWLSGLNQFLRANRRVQTVTFHRYPLHRCYTPRSSPTYPTISNLLAPAASIGPAASLAAGAAVAHAHGLPFRADELNSVSCGGAWGVSNTFASALWALDTLFHMAQVGVDGVNIHTFAGARYAPFAFLHTRSGWRAHVEPMYYGLLTFARAAPPGARLVRTHAPPTAGDALRTWATRARDGTLRMVLINDSPRRTLTLAIRPPASGPDATLERLLAPRLGATHGVTLAGQGFGPVTATGTLSGVQRIDTMEPIQNRYVVTVPPASAALITIPSR
jgi:hypothetical protein